MLKCLFKRAALCGAVVSLLVLSGHQARAQRTVWGQSFVSADYTATVDPLASRYVRGAEVFYGQYLASMYWQAGLQYTPGGKHVPVGCFTLSAGASYRLFATRSRMFNGYIGGNALFGADFADGTAAVEDLLVDPETGIISVSDDEEPEYGTGIVYGFEPRLELEFFPLRKVALFGGLSVPVKVNTQQDHVSGRLYFGLRINL